MDDQDRILPLAVGGGTVVLLLFAAIYALSGNDVTPATREAVQAQAAATVETVAEEVAGDVAEAAETAEPAVAETAEVAEEAAEAVAEGVAEAAEAAEPVVAETPEVAEAITEEAAEEVAEVQEATESAVAEAAEVTGAAMDGAFDPAAMTDEQRAAFRSEVRSYLMENPEVIIEAVNQLEARQADAQRAQDGALVDQYAAAIFDDGFSWVGGNPEGDVTLVEFLDYRCGYCRRAHPEIEELLASDGNIRIIVKEFPILGEASVLASRFAIAARIVGGDEVYKQVHDTLMTLNGDPSEPVLQRIAEDLGLDAQAVFDQMENPRVARQITETRALAQALGINGTPTFVLQDQMLRGYLPLDAMRQMVDAVRQDG